MPRSASTTKQDITNLDPAEIKDELTRTLWVSFQLKQITESLHERSRYEAKMEEKVESIERGIQQARDEFVSKKDYRDDQQRIRKIEDQLTANPLPALGKQVSANTKSITEFKTQVKTIGVLLGALSFLGPLIAQWALQRLGGL